MKNRFKREHIYIFVLSMLLVGAAIVGFNALKQNAAFEYSVQRVDTAMGTIVTLNIDAEGNAEAVGEQILEAVGELEEQTLSWRLDSSEVYRINQLSLDADRDTEKNTVRIALSEELATILETCIKLSGESEGAFDITIGKLARLWDIDSWAAGEHGEEQYHLPEAGEIDEAMKHIGYEHIELQGTNLMVQGGVQLDLGAVGKGIALDTIHQLLKQNDHVRCAVISMGGSILTYGQKPDKTTWNVAVIDPIDPSQFIGYLSLQGQWCVSTSGDYERYVEVDGVRYCHILDAKTGYPAAGDICSVTILTKNGLLSDALSTACYLLGAERGMELAQQYGAEVLFVDRSGQLTMSEGMRAVFHER
ncbi:MAG: FAD:protein FMN transferase [Lachnospiraceae bacterium]|nr:FAD:protein FMN transferase [Lachnospiraceae bacterium]